MRFGRAVTAQSRDGWWNGFDQGVRRGWVKAMHGTDILAVAQAFRDHASEELLAVADRLPLRIRVSGLSGLSAEHRSRVCAWGPASWVNGHDHLRLLSRAEARTRGTAPTAAAAVSTPP